MSAHAHATLPKRDVCWGEFLSCVFVLFLFNLREFLLFIINIEFQPLIFSMRLCTTFLLTPRLGGSGTKGPTWARAWEGGRRGGRATGQGGAFVRVRGAAIARLVRDVSEPVAVIIAAISAVVVVLG